MASSTGMRRGELLGIQWPDLDLGRARIAVRRSLVTVGHEVVVSEPRTAKGRRSVALDPATVAGLKAWRKHQAAERLAWGPAWTDSGLVFTREDRPAASPSRSHPGVHPSRSRRRSTCHPSARPQAHSRNSGIGRQRPSEVGVRPVNRSEGLRLWRLRRQWRLARIRRQWRLWARIRRQWRLGARTRHYVGHCSPPGCIRVAVREPRQTALGPLRPLTCGIASRDGRI
jgi:hypothetical protein